MLVSSRQISHQFLDNEPLLDVPVIDEYPERLVEISSLKNYLFQNKEELAFSGFCDHLLEEGIQLTVAVLLLDALEQLREELSPLLEGAFLQFFGRILVGQKDLSDQLLRTLIIAVLNNKAPEELI